MITRDRDGFAALIVHCPYWRDVLKYSDRGNLAEMRRAAAVLEIDWAADEEAEESRALLVHRLRLPEPRDLVGDLFAALQTPADIRGPDGHPTESLFGRFRVDDNPMLRHLL